VRRGRSDATRLALCWSAILLTAVGCKPNVAAAKGKAARALDARQHRLSPFLVNALARRSPNDTGVLGASVRLYSAERRLREATDALRRQTALAGRVTNSPCRDGPDVRSGSEDEHVVVCAMGLAASWRWAVVHVGQIGFGKSVAPTYRRVAVYALPRFNLDSTAFLLAPMMLDDHPAVRGEMLKSAVRLGDKSILQLTRAMGYLETNDYVIWNYIVMCASW